MEVILHEFPLHFFLSLVHSYDNGSAYQKIQKE